MRRVFQQNLYASLTLWLLLMKREDFHRWFNWEFWKAFKTRTFPIKIPPDAKCET